MPRLAYYAHHHGSGHLSRACAVLGHSTCRSTLFTSHPVPDRLPPEVAYVRLPDDAPRSAADRSPVGPFHYAPAGHRGVRARMSRLAAWASDEPGGAWVADVSCEVALLGRLLAVPVAVVRQHGARWDAPHVAAYRCASLLIAPFGHTLEEPDAPAWIRQKTVYTGGFSRFDARLAERDTVRPEPRTVAVVLGRGSEGASSGAAWRARDVAAAARATPDWHWTLLGPTAPPGAPPNLHAPGWTDDVFGYLTRSSVVVSAAGHNGVMEAAAAARPLILLPEPRPFDEQVRKAAALERLGAARVLLTLPPPRAWAELLGDAGRADPGPLAALVEGSGAQRMASALDALAARVDR